MREPSGNPPWERKARSARLFAMSPTLDLKQT